MDAAVGDQLFAGECEHDESFYVGHGQEVGRAGSGDGELAGSQGVVVVFASNVLIKRG